MKAKCKILALSLTLGSALVVSSSAAVVIQNTQSAVYNSGTTTTIAYTISSTTSNVLVFGTYIDANGAGAGFSGLSYNGTAATALISQNRVALGYVVLPNSTSGNFTFTASISNARSGYFVWELSGVDTSVAANTGTAVSDLTLTTTSDSRFVVDIFGQNGGNNNTAGSPVPDGTSNGLTASANAPLNIDASSGGWLGAGTTTLGAAGAYSLGWTLGTGSSSNEGEAAFAFAPIPEPSAFLLLGGMGVLSLLRRRRSA